MWRHVLENKQLEWLTRLSPLGYEVDGRQSLLAKPTSYAYLINNGFNTGPSKPTLYIPKVNEEDKILIKIAMKT